MRKKTETHLHFVGIGGIGMSGIAEVFLNQGYPVSGSDLVESESTRRLGALGARIKLGHRAENVTGAHVVVLSSAIRPDNPELLEARRLRIPLIPRAEMLGELMRGKTGIAVAGTHGKTTTTSMLATVLTSAGLDPTIVVGGRVDSLGGTNAKLGKGSLVVAEADESDGSFLQLPATYGVITNIDNDHLDHYGSLERLEDAFVAFVGKLPFYGMAAVCAEDPRVLQVLERFTKPVVTYGLSERFSFFARKVTFTGLGSTFEVLGRTDPSQPHALLGRVTLQVPGKHNVLNALAVTAVAMQMDLPFSAIQKGLADFGGVKRRFEILWKDPARRQMIVDDYGHHPTEVAATLAAARAYWPGRIVTVFQPHRFSRTLHCHDGFLKAFAETDVLYLTDIYAASEEPIPGVTSSSLAGALETALPKAKQIHYAGDLEEARRRVLADFQPGDLVLCLGAGSITRLASALAREVGAAHHE